VRKWLADGLARVHVPQPHRLVEAGGGEVMPVGAERDTVHNAGVPGERANEFAGVEVPQLGDSFSGNMFA
jgi:hypothetical protein